jgi:hypothetical protein
LYHYKTVVLSSFPSAEINALARNEVGSYKLNAVDPQLESAWFQLSSRSSGKLVSSLCFQIQIVLESA